ncbi:MAG: serine/threonine protein phosphatase [Burkholderiales bacterium PBB5]|nr:MAG: serine/threonine protein phosphatase [Burkholderiales bacterium PBB5]
MQRRDFLALSAAGGGAVFASGLAGCATATTGIAAYDDFYFVQLSDTHWGYQGAANPDAAVTLRKAVVAVNALAKPPDFIVFTGDLTHTTDDPTERRRRLTEFKSIVADLKVKTVRFMPGEHDASLDRGTAYKEHFGDTFYSFDHRGVHFIALDNVSDPGAKIGQAQLDWLKADLAARDRQAPIVVLTHRPLFDLAPKWDWATRDGDAALALLMPFAHVTVFYGHIHQEHHQMTGHIAHHSAKSLIFPLPAPGSQDKRSPLPWDASAPYKGLGFREVEAEQQGLRYQVTEHPVVRA